MKTMKEAETMSEVMEILINKAEKGTKEEQETAWKEYVNKIKEANNITEEKANLAAITNVGYMSGYYDSKIARLLNKAYGAYHPIFGTTIC